MKFAKHALSVIEIEGHAILDLQNNIDESFEKACELLFACQGRVIVTGMGKSGHIGRKIASTLSSTGTPAFFVHPAEAAHGDLGMMTSKDVLLAISHSGTSNEILMILPTIKHLGIPIITLTGNPDSPLAKVSNIHLNISVSREACPLGLAPTTSTTATLVMGDALAVALLEARGFSKDDFARSHPSGALGKRLLLSVDELAHWKEEIPCVNQSVSIPEALIEVTEKKLGMTCVVDDDGILVGIYTDGDIRRTLTKEFNIHTTRLSDVMTRSIKCIPHGTLAIDALNKMKEFAITSFVMVDEYNRPDAVIHLHDILRSGII